MGSIANNSRKTKKQIKHVSLRIFLAQTLGKRGFIYVISFFFFLTTIAFFSLIYSHLKADYSIINIVETTHSTQTVLYRLSALWSNHEGSILLWTYILSFYTFSTLFMRKIFYTSLWFFFMRIQAILNLFFLFFIFFTSNPFLAISVRSLEGQELNPILQDLILAIHPPCIYLGYLALSIPFSLTISYLKTIRLSIPNQKIATIGDIEGKFINQSYWYALLYYLRIYALIAWIFLTVGISLGSWWAYYELGWGGWWFWDPVENASLMPWIIDTALLHSILRPTQTSNLLNSISFPTFKDVFISKWIILLSLAAFFSSVLGTFFVRAGLLDSVHSFVSEMGRAYSIFIFLLFLFLYTISIYYNHFLLGKYNRYKNNETILYPLSKTELLSLNHIYLTSFYLLILFATLYPNISKLITNNQITYTVGPSFYNDVLSILLLSFLLLMVLSHRTRINYHFINSSSTITQERDPSPTYNLKINDRNEEAKFVTNFKWITDVFAEGKKIHFSIPYPFHICLYLLLTWILLYLNYLYNYPTHLFTLFSVILIGLSILFVFHILFFDIHFSKSLLNIAFGNWMVLISLCTIIIGIDLKSSSIIPYIPPNLTSILYIILFVYSVSFILITMRDQNPQKVTRYKIFNQSYTLVKKTSNFERLSIDHIPMLVTHLGFLFFIFVISFWDTTWIETNQILYPGDILLIQSFSDSEYQILFRGPSYLQANNYDSLYGNFLIQSAKNEIVGILFPEKRHYLIQDIYSSKVDIESNVMFDIHGMIGDGNIYTGWQTTFYLYPIFSFLWISSWILTLGVLIRLLLLKNQDFKLFKWH
uniref:Heme lyase n=1 Tax=Moramonas marocensis TaxID=1805496 RepID=A0A140F2I4_9EUKA|nr:heme lyase [Moramonas marocensis]